jgi:hypothetical protein
MHAYNRLTRASIQQKAVDARCIELTASSPVCVNDLTHGSTP